MRITLSFLVLGMGGLLCGCSHSYCQGGPTLNDIRPGMSITELQDVLIPIEDEPAEGQGLGTDLPAGGVEPAKEQPLRHYQIWICEENRRMADRYETLPTPYLLTFEITPASNSAPEQSRLTEVVVDKEAVAERDRMLEAIEDKNEAYREQQLEEFRILTESARRQAIYQKNKR